MRKKQTGTRSPRRRKAAPATPSGLIVPGESARPSATARSALANRSHRTDWR
jgi:hypothetical protein